MYNNIIGIKIKIIATIVKILIVMFILILILVSPITKNHLAAQTPNSQMLLTQKEIEDLNNQLVQANADMDKTAVDLATKEKDLKQINVELSQKTAILNQRIAAIYKNSNSSVVEVLFKAEDFNDFISRLKLLGLIADQDVEIVNEVKDIKDTNLKIKQSILDLEEKQKQDKDNIEKLLLKSEKQLELEEAALTGKLQNFKYGNAPTGKFLWPAVGPVTRPFGINFDPVIGSVRLHTGIDIGASRSAPVRAIADGQVIFAGTESGYGNSILIYHGGGYATWYAHLQGFNCSLADNVSAGQVIGFVGSTGLATGPHLHFEIRINGQAQNPIQYLQ